MKIIENRWIPFKGFKAISILNVIFVRKGTVLDITDIRHESVHWEQEKEMFIIGFYLWYLIEFLIRFIILRNWLNAYYSISLEQEAYRNSLYEDHIAKRKHFYWTKYLW